METQEINNTKSQSIASPSFIEANTVPLLFSELENSHIIPVFTKDNEPLISHRDFITIAEEAVFSQFRDEVIVPANIRVSHPVKGRIPDARNKPANQLEEWEKTIYYERMMFVVEIPSIRETIDGNVLNLTIGGVKSYSQDNLSSKKGADEHFKIFVGFKNQVCTNLCVWTDGLLSDVKVKNTMQLMQAVQKLLGEFQYERQLSLLQQFPNYTLAESQFASLVGRCKLYQYLSPEEKNHISAMSFGDYQINSIAKDYYQDQSFCRQDDGSINLWKVYNLFTGANKSSYIDGFLSRSANASSLVHDLVESLDSGRVNWFLN
jgi:hypothetical protein